MPLELNQYEFKWMPARLHRWWMDQVITVAARRVSLFFWGGRGEVEDGDMKGGDGMNGDLHTFPCITMQVTSTLLAVGPLMPI